MPSASPPATRQRATPCPAKSSIEIMAFRYPAVATMMGSLPMGGKVPLTPVFGMAQPLAFEARAAPCRERIDLELPTVFAFTIHGIIVK
jgi:hypothetical protein